MRDEKAPGPVTHGWGRMGSKDRAALSRLTSRAAIVARRDLRDAVSELRLIAAMVALTLAIPLASGIGVRALAAFGGGTAVVNRLSLVGAFFVVFIPASFSLVLALESFGGERQRTTLEVLLSTPLRGAEIHARQVAAVLAFALIMAVVALILLRMGFNGFSREALLARDVGLRRPWRRANAALRASFHQRPGLFRLVSMRRVPLLIAAAGFPLGALAGYLAGLTNLIPANVVRPVLSSLVRSTGGGGAIDEALLIFSHNVLAFLLVAGLAVVSAGLSGFLLTFAPGFILGFAAALSSWAF